MTRTVTQVSTNHDSDGTTADADGSVPAFDVSKMFTSTFQLGAGMLRLQQQLFASVLGVTNLRGSGMNDRDTNRPEAEREIQAEHELIAARAWEVSMSPQARGQVDDWLLAERELRAIGRIAGA